MPVPSIFEFANQALGASTQPASSAGSESPVDVIRQVATERGINPDYLIGLAKLETRLGDASIKGGGDDTRNLFNIKDFSSAGTGIRATDKAEGSNDRYRQYGSYRDSVEDLIGLLGRRYPGALKAESGQQFAEILKGGGYATDKDYVQKLAGVIGGGKSSASGAPAATASPSAYYSGHGRPTAGARPGVADMTTGDFAKEFSASAIDGIGSIGQFAGEGLAYAANKLSDSEDYESKNIFSPATGAIRETLSEGGKAARADSDIKGDAVQMLLGNFEDVELPDTAGGYAMLAANGFGSLVSSFIPIAGQAGKLNALRKGIAAADKAGDAVTAAKLLAQSKKLALATEIRGAGFGAAMTGGAAAKESRENVEKQVDSMEHADLLENVPVYAEAFRRSGDEDQSRQAVINSAGQFSALISAPFGAVGGYLGGKVVTDTLLKKGLANIAGKSIPSTVGRATVSGGVGGLVEGGQEVTEKMGGNMGENLAMGRDATSDLTRNTAGDFIGGAMVGSPVGAISGMSAPALPPVNPVAQQLDNQIAQGNSPLSRAAVAATPELKIDPITQRAKEIAEIFRRDGLLDELDRIGQPGLTRKEFLEAMAVATNPTLSPMARSTAAKSMEDAMGWLAAGAMPNQPGTGSPYSTELTVAPPAAPGGPSGPTGPAGPIGIEQDLNTVDGQTTKINENQIGGPRALPGPPGQATPGQPAPAGFFTPEDSANPDIGIPTTAANPDMGIPITAGAPESTAQAATESIAKGNDDVTQADQAVQGQPEKAQAPAATVVAPAPAPAARKQVTAPKAIALPESTDNPGTAQIRKRKAQLAAMAATGFTAVERRPEGFFLVNPTQNEEMRLDGPGDAQMARTVVARATPVAGPKLDAKWTAFHPESGTLNIPRTEMPQIKSEHRGAMVNFLAARGITGEQSTIPATDLKPTQAEFSQDKVDQAKDFKGGDRAILVSSDGHVLDGHHQWLAKIQKQEPVKVMRLNAPIAELLAAMKDFPSAGMTKEAAPATLASTTGVSNGQDSGAAGPGLGSELQRSVGIPGLDGANGSDSGETSQRGRNDLTGAAALGGAGATPGAPQDLATSENYALVERSIKGIADYVRVLQKRRAKARTPADQAFYDKQLRKSPVLKHAPKAELDAFNKLKSIWSDAMGDAPVVGYWDDRADGSAVDGFEQYGIAHVNLARPHMALQWTIGHEFEHATEKSQTPAQARLREYIWSQISEDGRSTFFEGFLGNGLGSYAVAKADPAQYQDRRDALQKEMLAEFMGARFTDAAWLKQLAKQKPNLFGEFVKEWLSMLDNMIQSLKSLVGLNEDSKKNVDKYLKDLQKAKAAALELAISWAEANPKLAQSTGAAQAVKKSEASDVQYSARTDAEQEYRDVVAELKDGKTWLRAPNGEPTKLTERQWVQARTPSFLKWFGDWRTGNIWGRDDVSKAVGENGEPIVVYHGTDEGGFMSFNQPSGTKRGDLGIFTTSDYEMARTYVKRGRSSLIEAPELSQSDLEDAGYEFTDEDGNDWRQVDDDSGAEFYYSATGRDRAGPFESLLLAVDDAAREYQPSDTDQSVVYAAFVNLRNPYESDFEGAIWNGSREDQWQVEVGGDIQYRDGRAFFSEEEAREFAKEFADPDDFDEGADYMVAAGDHYETTDDVVRAARRQGNDGAIIRQVIDGGGGYSRYDMTPRDVFVAFKPNQLKSADFNTGEFGETDDIRYSVRDPAIGDRTDVSKLPKGKPIPASVGVGSLENALIMARSKSYTKGRQLKVDLQDRVLAAAKTARVDLTAKTQESFKFLVGMVTRDAQLALQSNANAVGWYDKTVSRAIGALSTMHPEIETDPTARLAFLWALATTSNGLKVDKNFSLAEGAYVKWRTTGVMPSDAGIGNAAGAINSGLDLFNTLAEKMGHDRLFKFMATEFEVGQIDRMLGVSPGGEWKPTPVLGSAVLGPKIGNGFFSNLNGYFHALTIDRWLMRTWGRLTGTLLEVLPDNVVKSRAKLGSAISSMNDSERKMMAKLIGQPLRRTMTRAELDAVAVTVAKVSMKPDKRELMNATAATTRLRLDGNGHAKILDGQKEAPSGPAERNWMRAVFAQALTELNQGGKTMTMSDLQALLWYPERRLYDAAKSDDEVSDGYEDDEAPDYANAARDLALSTGVSIEAIQAAMDKAESRGTVRGQQLTEAEKAVMLKEFRSAPEQQLQLAFEVAPNPDDKESTAQWNGLSLKERDRITGVVKDAIFGDLVDIIGVKLAKPVASIGGFDGEINPNLIAQYKPTQVSIEQARLAAAAIGLALDQKSVALVDPRASGNAGLIRITFDGKVAKHAAAIFSALQAGIPEVDAFTARGNNFDVLNFTGMTNEALQDKMREVLDGLDIPLEYVISHGDIRSELVEKDSYEGYITGLRPGSGSEILRGVERIRDRARVVFAEEVGRAGASGLDRGARAGAGRATAARRDDVQLSTRTNGDRDRRPAGSGASDRQGVPQQSAAAGRGAGQNQGISGKPGRLDPLPGAPKVPGYHGPDPRLLEVAEQYALANGIDLKRQSEFVQVDPQRAARIAQAYADMQHEPKNPKVKEAFANLIKQTKAQYDALVDAGYKFWFIDFDAPGNADYASTPWNAMRDVRSNQTMGVFPTQDGFGSGDAISDNPLETTVMDFTWPSGSLDGPQKKVLANDLFRAVHDAFGHGLEGAGFRAQGEENAWQAHRRLFTGSAIGAITSETRGQNSWLNYGPNGESNQTAKVEDTVFADQKTGLMPEWTWTEGVAGDVSYSVRKDQDEQSNNPARELADVRRGGGGDQAGGRVPPRYGSPIPGAVSATGYHFSRQARTNLSSDFYGTGLKGAEAERLGGQANADIRPRVFFYVNKGNGVRAESGVGGYGHHVQLDNLYDVFKDAAGLVKKNPGPNNWERAVLEAGFDGYLAIDPIMPQGYAVLLGKKHGAVPVEQTQAPGAKPNPVMERPVDPGATRQEGGNLVKKPTGPEMMQLVNPAKQAKVKTFAPSFKLQFGSFRVNSSEAAAANLGISEFSPTFKFDVTQLSERETTPSKDRRSVLLELLACL